MERQFKTTKFTTSHTGQVFTMPSETIPDQSMSMRHILENHTRGLPIFGNNPKDAIWDDESRGINPKSLDLVDIQNFNDHANEMREKYEKTKVKKPKPQPIEEPEGQ